MILAGLHDDGVVTSIPEDDRTPPIIFNNNSKRNVAFEIHRDLSHPSRPVSVQVRGPPL